MLPQQPFQPRPSPQQNSGTNLEEVLKSLANNCLQFQQETRASIHNLEKQMG